MYKLTACLFFCMLLIQTTGRELEKQLKRYNINWTSQSKNSSESMPLGGGDIGCNVWVENGDILFYISRSGAFDENNQLLKLGRGRLRLEPNIFTDSESVFSQELKLHDGYIQIIGQNGKEKVTVNLWVDVFKPHINVSLTSTSEVKLTAFYENWRTADRQLPMQERSACFSYSAYEGDVVTYRDSIRYHKHAVLWHHRNCSDKLLIDFCINQQGLTAVKDELTNPQKNLTFGGLMLGKGMIPAGTGSGKYVDTPFTYWSLTSEKPAKKHQVKFALHTDQANTIAQWEKDLLSSDLSFNNRSEWQKTKSWWHNYWEKSYIFINADKNDPTDPAWQVGRNYQLFRYQLGCNAYGAYPTKFNGGLFTFDPVFVTLNNHGTPDYRAWGGGSHTAQNQRLVYWPMLKSGDSDMMIPQFNFYKNGLKNVEIATNLYWGHKGCGFSEHPETFGLPAASTWGFDSGARKRPLDTESGVLANRYVCHHHANQLEFSFMILEYYRFTGKDISDYLPFIKSSLRFFDEHYQLRQQQRTGKALDENGKLVFYPSTATEMYKIAKNPVDVIAGLKTTLPRMLAMPDKYIDEDEKKYYQEYLERLPEISFDTKNNYRVIKPAESWEYVANMEIPELYPVFPYGLFSIENGNTQVAINTYFHGESNKKRSFTACWSQVGIFASRIGLTDEAAHLVVDKLADSPKRFPTFWGPGPDWIPDTDHGGAGMINLQEMLIQTINDKIYLLPSWPKDWEVEFRLHAPNKAIIDCQASNGKITELKVSPQKRIKDIVQPNNK
ncbi:DUF5703 domain-containing protein [Sunxiuqinia rutila]|uniref:DUF5703 domain-containing protein n=1 Tax=Sunxiuqinia rutila TaxID=1397841 RepID=UPI003D35EF29